MDEFTNNGLLCRSASKWLGNKKRNSIFSPDAALSDWVSYNTDSRRLHGAYANTRNDEAGFRRPSNPLI